MENSLVLADVAGGCTLTKTTLEIPAELPFEEWEKLGKALRLLRTVHLWAVSDWLSYGEHAYGEKYAQAADATGLDAHTLHNVQGAGSRFPPERRREALTFEHHRLVAYLSREDQDRILDQAEKHSWTTSELRGAMKPPKDDPDPYYRLTVEWGKHPGEHIKDQIVDLALKTGGKMKSEKEVE